MIGNIKRQVNRAYVDNLKSFYDVDFKLVDFNDVDRIVEEINANISRSTNGQIDDVISVEEMSKVSPGYFFFKF